MDVEAIASLRRTLGEKGYRPLAVISHDQPVGGRVKKPGKQPLEADWIEKASRDPPPATYSAPVPQAMNTGVLTGRGRIPIVAIDVDVMDPEVSAAIQGAVARRLGHSPLVRVGKAPKTLLVYRGDTSFGKLQTRVFTLVDGTTARVEVLADGQMFVAYGVHPDTGREYEWIDGQPVDVEAADLPQVTLEGCQEVLHEAEEILLREGARVAGGKKANGAANGAAGGGGPGPGVVKVAHGPWARVNAVALTDIARWAPELFPGGEFDRHGALRVSSTALDRDLEEDLSIHPDGIQDYGEEVKLTAVALVARELKVDERTAGLWLCQRLGVEPPAEPKLVPLGYTIDERFVIADLERNIVVCKSGAQLTSASGLIELAAMEKWQSTYPSKKEPSFFNATKAGDALIQACRRAGPFDMRRLRGSGVWLEGRDVVVNLAPGTRSPSGRYIYMCFEPLEIETSGNFEPERVHDFLKLFNWRDPEDAFLLLGWLAIAPICGAVRWRPHVFIHGPTSAGKTKVMQLLKTLTAPLRLWLDGNTTEAGIRQLLGPNSLAVIMDEFESDHEHVTISKVIRLARSASTADDAPVARGTMHGTALTFCINSAFAFAAIRLPSMEPADSCRMVQLELARHTNDLVVGQKIESELRHFEANAGTWCATMVKLAPLLPGVIDAIYPHVVADESRHRDNMTTLLAGAFLAKMGRLPTEREAKRTAERACSAIVTHSEPFDDNDAMACLAHLYAHQVPTRLGPIPLGHLMAVAAGLDTEDGDWEIAEEMLKTYGIKVVQDAELLGATIHGGFVLANKSPRIKGAFERSTWPEWRSTLLKAPGIERWGVNEEHKKGKTERFSHGVNRAILIHFSLGPERVRNRSRDLNAGWVTSEE